MKIAIVLAATIFTAPVSANDSEAMVSLTTGNYVYPLCQSTASAANKHGCAWYIRGVIEGVQTLVQPSQPGHSLLCMPDDLPGSQLTAIFGKYLDDHPEQRNEPAIALIVRAMTTAFPPTDACG